MLELVTAYNPYNLCPPSEFPRNRKARLLLLMITGSIQGSFAFLVLCVGVIIHSTQQLLQMLMTDRPGLLCATLTFNGSTRPEPWAPLSHPGNPPRARVDHPMPKSLFHVRNS